MSLQSVYESFLANPKATALVSDASLCYVTTLTSYCETAPIIKHLETQRKVVRKKQEKTLNAIADRHALFLEVETVLEFVTGGGSYLPGLDDNFLTDHIVVLPIQHVVHFDSDSKIKLIRIYWDQASLLKSVEVIGSRAKSWPIKDGKDQIRLITTSTTAAQVRNSSEAPEPRRPSSARATKDPHGTLEPFAANIPEENEEDSTFDGPAIPIRASARPAQRDLDELFVNEHEQYERGVSPSKKDVIAPKIGAGKNYQENRLFGEAQSPSNEIKDKFISPHPTKFNHFEFGDGHDEEPPKPSAPKPHTKHQSQWDFHDFMTPVKPKQRIPDQRTFKFEDRTPEVSPVRKPYVPHARKDADCHFEIQDDGGEVENSRGHGHQRGQQSTQLNNKNLFSNNVTNEGGAIDTNQRGRPLTMNANTKDRQKDFGNHWDTTDNPTHGEEKTLGNITNIKDRHKDFDPHFKITNSPSVADKQEHRRPLGEDQNKHVKSMQANWESADPDSAGKENRIMSIAGNGMGGRKGIEREWGLGDHDQPTQQAKPVRKGLTTNQRSSLWDQ